MIQAILVDDERPALKEMEHCLKEYPEVEVVGMFTDPKAAIERIGAQHPDVVFLDINMPQLLGMDAASQILDLSPNTDIVFVTAYDQYALEAFEVHAIDYLLKPVEKERLDKTIERLKRKNVNSPKSPEKKLRIKCFGRFLLEWEGEEPLKWRTEKTRELFAFLLHDNGRGRSKEELLDLLWQEDDPEKAVRQLYNGIYYIKKALEEYGVKRDLICIDSEYRLRLGAVSVDVNRFHELEGAETEAELEELEKLYCGTYFQGADYSWVQLEQERLAKICRKALLLLAEKYAARDEWEKAEQTLIKAYEQDPYEEEVTEKLLRCYVATGNAAKAKRHFAAYSELLFKELGVRPGAKVCALLNEAGLMRN